ncbi:putative phosphatase regulatory subunit-domain-containing protein, partial [Syncephalis fuscata]
MMSLSSSSGRRSKSDVLDDCNRAIEEAHGLRSGQFHLQLVNLPETSVFHLTMRPISIEWIRLADKSRHLRVLTCCQNLAFQKTVLVRYTLDNWQSHDDVSSEFYDSISNGNFDRFLAYIPFDASKVGSADYSSNNLKPLTIEICIRYIVDGKEFWDNNRGNNYRVIISRLPSISDNNDNATLAPSHDYFSLPATDEVPEDNQSTKQEHQTIQQEAEKAWQQVLLKSRIDGEGDDDEDEQQQRHGSAKLATVGQSPDNWLLTPRKPVKKNGSFASRYDFGASLKAATRSGQRRPLRRMTSSSSEDEEGEVEEAPENKPMVEVDNSNSSTTLYKKQIGFTLPTTPPVSVKAKTATTTTTATSPDANPSSTVAATTTTTTTPKSTSALSRAISVSKPLSSSPITVPSTINTSLSSPVLPWSRSHSPKNTTGPAVTAAPVSPHFSNKSSIGRFASSPSVLFLDEGLRSYTTTAATTVTTTTTTAATATPTTTANANATTAATPYASTPYHSMMMTSFGTSPSFGSASFGFYGGGNYGGGYTAGHSSYLGDYKDEMSYYDAANALSSPKTTTSLFRSSNTAFYQQQQQQQPQQSSLHFDDSRHTGNHGRPTHTSSPFSDSPLSSPSTTPMPWI